MIPERLAAQLGEAGLGHHSSLVLNRESKAIPCRRSTPRRRRASRRAARRSGAWTPPGRAVSTGNLRFGRGFQYGPCNSTGGSKGPLESTGEAPPASRVPGSARSPAPRAASLPAHPGWLRNTGLRFRVGQVTGALVLKPETAPEPNALCKAAVSPLQVGAAPCRAARRARARPAAC